MDDVEQLFAGLDQIFPLSEAYKTALGDRIKPRNLKHRKILLNINSFAGKIWQLLEGCLIASVFDSKGKELVVGIYLPKAIVTDLHSFLKAVPSRVQIRAVGNIKVLEIKKTDIIHLRKYPENNKLIRGILEQEQKREYIHAGLMRLSIEKKVSRFAGHYPIDELTNDYCASFLRMTLNAYTEQKIKWKRSFLAKDQQAATLQKHFYKSTEEMVYGVRTYILENYKRADINNTIKIAAQFNTTKKTLTRAFIKYFDITAHKFILKLRMEFAHSLLLEKHSLIKDVAIASGYQDIYTFSRIYKQYYGFPPNQTVFNK